MKVLLPSLINDELFKFSDDSSWFEIYEKYSTAGIDRNPFTKHLKEHGINAVQYWINFEQAQKSWANEHKIKYEEDSWFLGILEAQILHEQPDVIYNTTFTIIPYEFIERMKAKLRKRCLWVCFYGVSCTGEFRKFREYDFFLTGFREMEKELVSENQKVLFFPHYFDDQLCKPFTEEKKSIPFSFLGSLCYKYDDHTFSDRRRLVEKLMNEVDLEVWSHLTSDLNCPKEAIRQRWNALRWEIFHLFNSMSFPANQIAKLPLINKVKGWEVRPTPDFFFNARLTRKANPSKYGRELYECLSLSAVTLNVHGQVDANFGQAKFAAGNIRLFEATGSGACLLTDNLPHLDEFFDSESEIVTYDSHADAIDKARFLLNNPKESQAIAKRGMARAWKDHSSGNRAKQFAMILNRHA